MSDIHSYYDEMQKALNDAGFDINNPEHVFISLGDLLDRGSKPKECLDFVNNLPDDRKVLIMGNHEELMDDCIERDFFFSHDWHNGTAETVKILTDSLQPAVMENCEAWKKYRNSLVNYYEIDRYIFVHGWIPIDFLTYEYLSSWREVGDWRRARWYNGMEMWGMDYREPGKTIVCGHWHTSYGHSRFDNNGSEFGDDAVFTPFRKDGIVAIDACTAHTNFCNCLVLTI